MTTSARSTALTRRIFNLGSVALAAGATPLMTPLALAQGAPVEGKDFVKLPAPMNVPAGGKVDVIEFFWYGCPHCYSFEPSIETWTKKIPQDVAFRRVHVAFTAMHETHAKMFYAMEQIGALETMHKRVFNAMHQQNMRFLKEAEIVDFMKTNGVDATKFSEAYRSFGVATKVAQAKQLVDGYKIDGVPALGIHGRWYTSPSLTGSPVRALAIADYLIERARKG